MRDVCGWRWAIIIIDGDYHERFIVVNFFGCLCSRPRYSCMRLSKGDGNIALIDMCKFTETNTRLQLTKE